MKLWQAILKGAKMGKQLYGTISDDDGNSCAIGSALIVQYGMGPDHEIMLGTIVKDYPALDLDLKKCPVSGCVEDLNVYMWNRPGFWVNIAHLNNQHKWSRENIAHWVRSIEDPASLKKETTNASITKKHTANV
jgi:hypothetical protein